MKIWQNWVAVLLMRFYYREWIHIKAWDYSCRSPYEIQRSLRRAFHLSQKVAVLLMRFYFNLLRNLNNFVRLPFSLWDSDRSKTYIVWNNRVAVLLMRFEMEEFVEKHKREVMLPFSLWDSGSLVDTDTSTDTYSCRSPYEIPDIRDSGTPLENVSCRSPYEILCTRK